MGLAEATGVISVVVLAEAGRGLARVICPDSKQRSVKTCNIDLILCRVYPIRYLVISGMCSRSAEDAKRGDELSVP